MAPPVCTDIRTGLPPLPSHPLTCPGTADLIGSVTLLVVKGDERVGQVRGGAVRGEQCNA